MPLASRGVCWSRSLHARPGSTHCYALYGAHGPAATMKAKELGAKSEYVPTTAPRPPQPGISGSTSSASNCSDSCQPR